MISSQLTAENWKKFWSKVQFTNGCWNWTTRSGILKYYGCISFNHKQYKAHILSYEYFYGQSVPPGLEVCHHCDNAPCVNPEHLFVGTHAQNLADASAKGRTPRGSRDGNSKLKEDDIPNIRALSAEGVSGIAIGKWYGVDPSTIYKILWGKRWRHVPPIS